MANIKVNDIKPAGAELFADSEGYLDELKSDEISNVLGGSWKLNLTFICFPRANNLEIA